MGTKIPKRHANAKNRPKKLDTVVTIIRTRIYFPNLLNFGVCSSKCPIKIFPIAKIALITATSNQSVFGDHINNG